jgi:hypothetical protein
MLTVIQLHCGGHGLHVEWECLCDCGNTCNVAAHKLRNGHTKSCGCLRNKRPHEDLTGQKFNLLTVVSLHSVKNGKVRWNCICECGNKTEARSNNLKSGSVKSCGCLRKTNPTIKTHGLTNTRLYHIWENMKARCYNPNIASFKNYGARGIKICEEWLKDNNMFFEWAMNNGYNETLTIERIDNNLDYCPENCKWIPIGDQPYNKRNVLGIEKVHEIRILFNSKIKLKDIAAKYEVCVSTIKKIKYGKYYANV